MLGTSWVGAQLAASRERLSSMELVGHYLDSVSSNDGVTDELKRIRKEAIVAYSGICLENHETLPQSW
jgi:hypothetical protein